MLFADLIKSSCSLLTMNKTFLLFKSAFLTKETIVLVEGVILISSTNAFNPLSFNFKANALLSAKAQAFLFKEILKFLVGLGPKATPPPTH
jgi:hypothetical protein